MVGCGVAGHPGHVDLREVERLAGAQSGQGEEVFDQRPIRLPSLSMRDHALSSSSGSGQSASSPQLGIAHDGGDRGAQLVGGVGDELAQTLLTLPLGLHRMLDVAQHLVE